MIAISEDVHPQYAINFSHRLEDRPYNFCVFNPRRQRFEEFTGPFTTKWQAWEWREKWGEFWKKRGFKLLLTHRHRFIRNDMEL